MFTFDSKKVLYHDPIASGAFGSVYPYRDINDITDDRWVVKHLLAQDSTQLIRYIQEIVLGFNCEHPAIVPMRGYYIDEIERNEVIKWNIFIKLPRMVETLKDKITRQIGGKIAFTEEELVQDLYTMASGLKYLHQRRIAHRDIKPSNVLIDKERKLKLADIGIAEYVAEGETSNLMKERSGTKLYMAPEILSKETRLKNRDLYKADIWSLGVVFAQMCLLEPADKIGGYLRNPKEIFDRMGGRYSKVLVDLVEGMVSIDAEKRMSAGEICRILEKYRGLVENQGMQVEEEKKEESGNRSGRRIIELKSELEKKWEGVFRLGESLEIQPIDRSRITDKSLEDFFKETGARLKGKNVNAAQHFSINLSWCNEITGIGLKRMMSQIANNATNVQDLLLDLKGCKKVTDGGVKEMMDTIYNEFSSLKSLTLDFTKCYDLTDKGIKELASLRESNESKSLQSLSFKFFGCNQITDEGIKGLSEQITQKLTHLKDLQLDFSWCSKITDKGVNELTSCLKDKLPNLQRLSIELQAYTLYLDRAV